MTNQNTGSAVAGSPIGVPADPNVLPVGQTQVTGDVVPKAQHDALESKLGEMGNELGEYRQFFNDISPLLEKIDKSPELAKAILHEKFDSGLAAAILDGRVSVAEAGAVQQAAATVQQQLGQPAFNAASPEEIAKLVEKEVNKVKEEFERRDEMRNFEQRTADFIANTPDLADYADEMDKWFNDHADITDVETAYYAVKGKMSAAEAAKKAAEAQAETSKNMALNASGGGSSTTHIRRDAPLIDRLIAPRGNPNMFG